MAVTVIDRWCTARRSGNYLTCCAPPKLFYTRLIDVCYLAMIMHLVRSTILTFPSLMLLMLLIISCAVPPTPPPTPVPPDAPSLPPGFDIQGHRGVRGLKPENTLPAFEIALDLMVTTLEMDLHYSKDGVVVIWHDDDITIDKCTYAGSGTPALAPDPTLISQLSFEEIQKYRCDLNGDSQKHPQQNNHATPLAGDDYRIISLAELFDFVDAYAESDHKTDAQRQNARLVQFNIETKRKIEHVDAIGDGWDGEHPGKFERSIVSLVEERELVQRVIVQSFVHASLWGVRQLNPNIRLAALTKGKRPSLSDYADYAHKGATIWSPRYQDVTPALLQQAHKAGLQVIPWTINDPAEMKRMIQIGVNGIITDRPDLLLALEDE